MNVNELSSYRNNNPWRRDEHPDGCLWLVTESEFEQLPDGTELESISGRKVTKGIDKIDTDERFGMMPYGLRSIRHGKPL